ncbi:hypothetical protein IQ244_25885 [Nostoc sp. LEGE 06077]|uniref:hypothetical protein n=1 Tax=Nostoc sp. LEGE 06077 TaxID=915325 RepID=UPI001880FCDA|nr:hypothetical protein [Nostoc sp. LEGE 06077]MBE9209864.1 hypothetical protein [Nostoc sp. LEGE 06077]
MNNLSQLTILVNSTDSFEDCWQPFFQLFSIYWPNCPYPIILNTETKTFSYPGLNIQCSQIGLDKPSTKLSWSDCLIRCLDKIKTKYVLYLQEDYFINDYVNTDLINDFLQIMEHEECSHIRLMEIVGNRNEPYQKLSKYPLLWELRQKCNYRISLQAGIWVKDRLRFYLKPEESGWEFERWGSIRASKEADKFYCQSLDYFNRQNKFIIPYSLTGIVRGKWLEEAVVDLFQKHDIKVDYSVRGFYRLNQRQQLLQSIRKASRKLFVEIFS